MAETIDKLIDAVAAGQDLTQAQSSTIFQQVIAGQVTEDIAEKLLSALAEKGETTDEIVGAAEAMRLHSTPIACDDPCAIDTCGTGGDGISTFNVSTAAAIVAAAAGARVAKHGNRSHTRASGSAEVMRELGVNIDATPDVVARCLREVGIAFLNAARLHPAMGRLAQVRRKLGRPTILNLLGPLTNPAGVRRQVVGVPREDLVERIAAALQRLGADHALVVHGDDGLCDLTITTTSRLAEVREGRITRAVVEPEDVGLSRGPLDALRVSGPAESAAAVRAILGGERGPRRDHTLLNAAAALKVAGVAGDLGEGVARSQKAIDSGAAAETLRRLAAASGGRG